MNTLQLSKRLEFKTEDELFNYLTETYYNGQFTQAKSLFHSLNPQSRKAYIRYLHETGTDQQVVCYYFELL